MTKINLCNVTQGLLPSTNNGLSICIAVCFFYSPDVKTKEDVDNFDKFYDGNLPASYKTENCVYKNFLTDLTFYYTDDCKEDSEFRFIINKNNIINPKMDDDSPNDQDKQNVQDQYVNFDFYPDSISTENDAISFFSYYRVGDNRYTVVNILIKKEYQNYDYFDSYFPPEKRAFFKDDYRNQLMGKNCDNFDYLLTVIKEFPPHLLYQNNQENGNE